MGLIFNRLIITDIKENVSKKISFSPKCNLLTSDANGKGKSTIMKSLYHALGANAAFDDNIDKKAIIFDLDLKNGLNNYRIIRYVDQYLIFKNNALDLSCKHGNISALSEYYRKEFGMYVYLKDRQGGLPIAPPAYLFIPYYLDQDYSWKKEQMPFDSLGQYEKISKNDLYYYHLSVFTDEYNDTKSKYREQQQICDKISDEIKQSENIYMQLKEQISVGSICIDEKEIEILISHLARQVNEMLSCFSKTKNEIFLLENEKAECISQIAGIEKGLTSIEKNIKKESEVVVCPNCGVEINIEKDIKDLYNKTFLQNRKDYYLSRIDEIDKLISFKSIELDNYTKQIKMLEARLNSEQTTYDTYMKRKVADSLFNELLQKIGNLKVKLSDAEQVLAEFKEILNNYEIKTSAIKENFKACYIGNLIQLNVKKFNSEKIKAFQKLAIGGSQYVRSTLAFFYSFIELKKQYNKGEFVCPLIIDSPREGEQDDMNSQNILKFIFNKYDGDEQLIVASVNGDKYIKEFDNIEDINIIKLENEDNQVMTKQNYAENIDIINDIKSYLGLN